MKKSYALLPLFLISGSGFAIENQSTVCQLNGQQRVIEVVYPQGSETPCEVRYTKQSETKVLWNAQAEIGYCEEKAQAFISKQQGWGWQCTSSMSQASQADDSMAEPSTEQDSADSAVDANSEQH